MKRSFGLMLLVALSANMAHAQFANQVISYDAGSTPAPGGYTNSSVALGSPQRIAGESSPWPSDVTVFNGPFANDEIVSIGEGGHLTLRLSNFVLPDPSGPEIGVFENIFLIDGEFDGVVDSPVSQFGGDSAEVAVSEDGNSWVTLGTFLFDLPAQGFTDLSGTPSDFQQPFTGTLNSFANLPLDHATDFDVFDLLAGSGGGNWLDISSAGLSQVGYIRFSVADDLNAGTSLNFELDAVSISASAMGGVVPEPSSLALVGIAFACSMLRRK
jgi:hypothetical protein